MAKAYDPKISSVTVQYITPTAESRAFITAYDEDQQSWSSLSPNGETVQPGGEPWV